MNESDLGERIRHLIDSENPVGLDEVVERSRPLASPKRRVGRWGRIAPVAVAVGVAAAVAAVVAMSGSTRPTTAISPAGGSTGSVPAPTTSPPCDKVPACLAAKAAADKAAQEVPISEPPATSAPSTTAAAPQVPGTFAVPGYTPSTAAAAVANCMTSTGFPAGTAGNTLRAAFRDSWGSELVITSASGWSMCGVSTAGEVVHGTVSVPEAYAAADGWGMRPAPPGDAPASWLVSPVELDSEGGGIVTLPSGGGFLWTVEGRVTSGIAQVKVGMPDGTLATAPVQNGFFVARKLFPSDPVTNVPGSGPVTIPIQGFDSSGALVYTNPSTADLSCYVTPSGEEVTPQPADGGPPGCKTATPW